MRSTRLLLMCYLTFGFATAPVVAVDRSAFSVWAVNDGEKIAKDDLQNPAKKSNSVWDGKRVTLFGARNEIVAFQLVVEGGEKGIDQLRAALAELRQVNGSHRITYLPPASDPTVTQGRPIQLFSVNYMRIERPSQARWIYDPAKSSLPANPTGWKPVQIIPENARVGRGGFPLKVAARTNQLLWIEIYIATDTPAGLYTGDIKLTADQTVQTIPIQLRVFKFDLPDSNSLNAMVVYDGKQTRAFHGHDLDARYHRFAHRNRIEFTTAYNVESAQAALGRFTGTDFSDSTGYEGPGKNVGNQIVPASLYSPGRGWDTERSARSQSDRWMQFLHDRLPGAITFLYMIDEPRPDQYAQIRSIARHVHSNPNIGKNLPILVSKPYVNELDGAVNIWVSPANAFRRADAQQQRNNGNRYWIYNGGRPQAGAVVIEAPATDPRALIWACFKENIELYFYWHGVYWERHNIWSNPVTFDNRDQTNRAAEDRGVINGDGVLVYPGEDVLHPEEDRGIEGPCSTVQLANFRRGLQDHQYLTLAQNKGLNQEVDHAVKAVVPQIFDETGDHVGFSEKGDDYERERFKLGVALEQKN